MNKNSTDFSSLVECVEKEMRRLGYTENSLRHYWEVWGRFRKYLNGRDFAEKLCLEFLSDVFEINELAAKKLPRQKNGARRAIKVLLDYNKFSIISLRHTSRPKVIYPPQFEKETKLFFEEFKGFGRSKVTITEYENQLKKFLLFLDTKGVTSFRRLTPEHITKYIPTITGYNSGSMGTVLSKFRVFFLFLYRNSFNDIDLSLFIPKSNTIKSREHLPTIWSKEEIKSILTQVDVSNPTGKRDYAIILLVSRSGLRISDVKNLTFSDIKWEKNTIELVQAKTKEPISLPLFEDVGAAIIDYIKNGRPMTDTNVIFIRHISPFTPFNQHNRLHHMINKYIYRAGVEKSPENSHGMHTLRHSLASELVKENVPLPIISEIMGHKNLDTTANYIRVDIEHLRQCTLELEV